MADYNLSYPTNNDFTPFTSGGDLSGGGSTGGGGGFDYNALIGTVGDNLGSWFSGIAQLVYAANGTSNSNPYNPYAQSGNPFQTYTGVPQPAHPVNPGISSTTIVVLVVLLILVLVVVYLLAKQAKKA